MGLLDNLFKPKPENDGEKSVENSAAAEPAELQTPAAKGSPFLAPKHYVPRSSMQIVPPARSQLQVAPAAEAPPLPKEIVLTLGDVLPRIPTHFLRQGMPDARRELRFATDGLAADIARGRASVFLAEIVAQCPDIFLPEAGDFDDTQIRLPLQKLVEQIGLAPVLRDAGSAPGGSGLPAARAIQTNTPPPQSSAAATPEADSVPAPAPDAAPEEALISLSLAVVLTRCPKEIIVQPLPPIDESVRIAFPFPPIERQLATGQVEVSSLRFIAALPLGLMRCFEAKAGVKVPLPLEEIFQNLPEQNPARGVAARFHPPAPEIPDADAAARAMAAKNAKLAEAILLEPVAPPIGEAAAGQTPAAVSAPGENIINANFSAEPAEEAPALPPVELAAPLPSENRSEPMKVELAEIPASPLEKPASGAVRFEEPQSSPIPERAVPAASAPSAPALETSAFHRVAPPLPPPVLLPPQANSTEHPPSAPTPPPPESSPLLAPESPVKVSVDSPPGIPETREAFPPPPEVVATPQPEPAPVGKMPEPPMPAGSLRIAPPQFRPVVVRPPLVVGAPDAPPFIVQAAAPEPPPLPPANVAPEPIAEIAPVESEPPVILENPLPIHAPAPAPAPESPVATAAPSAPIGIERPLPALFESEVSVALLPMAELLAALPGIGGCLLTARTGEAHAGELPAGLDAPAVRALSHRMHAALADRASEVQHLTLQAGAYALTLFIRGEACVCAVHRASIFLPGVRERFAAVAEDLARARH